MTGARLLAGQSALSRVWLILTLVLARAGAQQHCCFPAHPVSAVSAESGSDRAYTMMMMMPALPCFVHHGLHVESVASSGIRSAACNINDSSQVACGVCYSDTQFLAVFFSVDYPQQIYRIVMCTHYLQCYFARCYNAGRRLRGRRSFSVGSAVLSDLLQWPVGLQLWCRLFVLKAEVAAYCAKLSKCKTLVHESIFSVPTEMDFGLLLFGIWKYLICARHWTQPFHSVQMDRVKHLLTSCWCETEFICLTLISTRILYSINQSIKRRF